MAGAVRNDHAPQALGRRRTRWRPSEQRAAPSLRMATTIPACLSKAGRLLSTRMLRSVSARHPTISFRRAKPAGDTCRRCVLKTCSTLKRPACRSLLTLYGAGIPTVSRVCDPAPFRVPVSCGRLSRARPSFTARFTRWGMSMSSMAPSKSTSSIRHAVFTSKRKRKSQPAALPSIRCSTFGITGSCPGRPSTSPMKTAGRRSVDASRRRCRSACANRPHTSHADNIPIVLFP